MTGFPTVNFSDSEQGLFTPREIRALMKVEFDRAVRYDYPIVCMLLEVDRLESLHDLYGYESKEEILNSVIGLLRSMTRASDFLGCMQDDRLMAMFPHTSQDVAARLAERLLVGARKLRFDSDGRTLRATLSVGISYCDVGDRIGYEEFRVAAEEALELAMDGGGDRFVIRGQALKSEMEELRDDLEAQRILLQEERLAGLSGPLPNGAEPQPAAGLPGLTGVPIGELVDVNGLPDTPLGEKLRLLFQQLGPQETGTARIQEDIIQLTLAHLNGARSEPSSEALEERNSQIDQLERRVRKLADLLELTEAELARVAQMKDVDPGIASIYRAVQGLSGRELDFELKKQFMAEIFKANLALKEEMQRRI